MIRMVRDSDGGGSKRKKKGGGIDTRKGAISGRRTSLSLLAAVEEESMYSCLHSRSDSDLCYREGYEC